MLVNNVAESFGAYGCKQQPAIASVPPNGLLMGCSTSTAELMRSQSSHVSQGAYKTVKVESTVQVLAKHLLQVLKNHIVCQARK